MLNKSHFVPSEPLLSVVAAARGGLAGTRRLGGKGGCNEETLLPLLKTFYSKALAMRLCSFTPENLLLVGGFSTLDDSAE